MAIYKNLGGDSGVLSYEISDDSIDVQFEHGKHRFYLYTENSVGTANLEEMKRLAIVGQGLNSFINRVVKKMYASKR